MLPVLEILISLCVCSSTFSHSRSLLFPRPALAASEGPGLRYTYDKSKGEVFRNTRGERRLGSSRVRSAVSDRSRR